MIQITETGGARIGMANATWPFATLKVNRDKLELNATIIGNLVFRPSDIISIVPQYGIFGRGLKIIHRVPTYRDKIIFWTSGNPAELIERIEQTGFLTNSSSLPTNTETEILHAQLKGGFPIKLPAAIIFGVIWNILLMVDFIDFFGRANQTSPLGTGSIMALSFAFATGLLVLTTQSFRKLLLKEGRALSDIKAFVYFMMVICGLMILSIAFMN